MLLAPTILGLLSVCSVGAPAAAAAPSVDTFVQAAEDDDATRFAALLLQLDPALDDDLAVAKIAKLGVATVTLVLDWHRPEKGAASGRSFDAGAWSRIERAVERVSRPEQYAALAANLAGDDPPQVAAAGLRLMGRIGASSQTDLLLELVDELKLPRPSGSTNGELALTAFAGIQLRDSELSAELGARATRIPEGWIAPLARVVALGESPRDLMLTLRGLEARVAEEPLLSVLGQVAPRFVGRVEEADLVPLRRRLLSADVSQMELATIALARLGDDGIVEQLIAFLTQSNTRVRSAAHFGLHELTGLPFGADSERWELWHAKSVAWWDEHGATLADDVRWLDSERAIELIIEIAPQKMHRAELLDALLEAFERDEEEVVDLAILCMRELRWSGTTRRLVVELEHHSARSQGRAWRALRTLTGLDAGPEASAWRAALLL
jgi:hypothetical protein